MVFGRKKKTVYKKANVEPEEQEEDEELERDEDSDEDDYEDADEEPTPKKKKKVKSRFELAEVSVKTAPVIVDNKTGEYYNEMTALVKILNILENR